MTKNYTAFPKSRWFAPILTTALLVTVYATTSAVINHSLRRASMIELGGLYNGWVAGGKPRGGALSVYMSARNRDIVATNTAINIGGTNYLSEFAMVRPKTSEAASLFVTTDGRFIWVKGNHRPRFMSLDE